MLGGKLVNYNIETIYMHLDSIESDEFPEVDYEFYSYFSEKYGYAENYDENVPECITVFMILEDWYSCWFRGGSWTFYEYYAGKKALKITLNFLRKFADKEMADIFESGIHEYDNPKYKKDSNYPKEWLDEAEQIDIWIENRESEIFRFLEKILIDNKKTICGKNNKSFMDSI